MPAPRKLKILVVDDSFVMRRIIRQLLAESEFDLVAEAAGGREAVEQFARTEPDLVLLDLVLPELDGKSALQDMLRLHPDARVVIASSQADRAAMLELVNLGARSFLVKPLQQESLLTALRAAAAPAAPAPKVERPAAPPKWFGTFLVERGRITPAQLAEVERAIAETDRPLGALALEHGFLRPEDAERINHLQLGLNRKFGEIALEQGLLSDAQLESLLLEQARRRPDLGELLFQQGILTRDALDFERRAFRREQEGVPASAWEIYRQRPHAHILEVGLDILTKLFLRIAHETVQAGPCATRASDARLYDYSVRQRFRGDLDLEWTLNLTADLMGRIASRMLGETVAADSEDARDGTAEFFNIVNGHLCRALGSMGIRVTPTPPDILDNRRGRGLDLIAASVDGQLTITPLVHRSSGVEWCLVDRSADGWKC